MVAGVTVWPVLAGFIVVFFLVHLHGRRDDRLAHQRWLAYQADYQHRYVMAGDDLGVYGHLRTVENMRLITDWTCD